ncbi:MAG: hypothetical protein ACLRSH_06670 [Turicibacter sp.]
MPEEVTIGGLTYRVYIVDNLAEKEGCYGEIDYINQTIKIDGMISDERRKQTLLHEVMHGILESIGELKLNQNEQKVQSIASALYQCLKNNAISF